MINIGCIQALTLLLSVVTLVGQNTARTDIYGPQANRKIPVISSLTYNRIGQTGITLFTMTDFPAVLNNPCIYLIECPTFVITLNKYNSRLFCLANRSVDC